MSSQSPYTQTSLPCAGAAPLCSALFKAAPEDFEVREIPGFKPDGAGEHVCLRIEKSGLTTPEAVRLLARHFRLPLQDFAWAGLKDRQALTEQWFSVRLNLKDEKNFTVFEHPQLRVLEQQRNSRKIRHGSHKGNHFRIRLRNIRSKEQADSSEAAFAAIAANLLRIQAEGFPNYFGPQRFGHGAGNLPQAEALFRGEIRPRDRVLRGLLLSSARAWLFNQYLAQRVLADKWSSYVPGDVMALEGSTQCFLPAEDDPELEERLQRFDIHPTGPLWGRGELRSQAQAAAMERQLAADYPLFCQGLENFGLQQDRRALRAKVENLQIDTQDQQQVVIEFSLGRGSYATSLLREVLDLHFEP